MLRRRKFLVRKQAVVRSHTRRNHQLHVHYHKLTQRRQAFFLFCHYSQPQPEV